MLQVAVEASEQAGHQCQCLHIRSVATQHSVQPTSPNLRSHFGARLLHPCMEPLRDEGFVHLELSAAGPEGPAKYLLSHALTGERIEVAAEQGAAQLLFHEGKACLNQGEQSQWVSDLLQYHVYKDTTINAHVVLHRTSESLTLYADFARRYTAKSLDIGRQDGTRFNAFLDIFFFDIPNNGAHVWVSLSSVHQVAFGREANAPAYRWYHKYWQQWSRALVKEGLPGCHMRRAVACQGRHPTVIVDEPVVDAGPQPLERVLGVYSVSLYALLTLLAKFSCSACGGDRHTLEAEMLTVNNKRWTSLLRCLLCSWVWPMLQEAPVKLQLFLGPSSCAKAGSPMSGTARCWVEASITGGLQFHEVVETTRLGKAFAKMLASQATWDMLAFTIELRANVTLRPLWPQWLWHLCHLAEAFVERCCKPAASAATAAKLKLGRFATRVRAGVRQAAEPQEAIEQRLLRYFYCGRRVFGDGVKTLSYSCDFTRMSKRGCGTGLVCSSAGEVFWCPPQAIAGEKLNGEGLTKTTKSALTKTLFPADWGLTCLSEIHPVTKTVFVRASFCSVFIA